MSKKRAYSQVVIALLAAAVAASVGAQTRDASRLGKDLTAAGAEPGASKDGSIPAFTGTESPAGGWAAGKKRLDHWKHKAEKPLYTIDASNVDKYADRLSPARSRWSSRPRGTRWTYTRRTDLAACPTSLPRTRARTSPSAS